MKSVKETVKIRVCKGGSWERVNGALEYMPSNCVKRTLCLPLLSSHSLLLQAVSKRLDIDAKSGFMLTYNSDNDILEVCDDLEVNEFMEFVVKSSRIVTLCIVESSLHGRQISTAGSNQLNNFSHATPSVNVFQTEYHATQIHQAQMPVFAGGVLNQNLSSYQQMQRSSESPMYFPGFCGYPLQEPQVDSSNIKRKNVVLPKKKKPSEFDLLDDAKLRPFGQKVMGSVFGKLKGVDGEDEISEDDDDNSQYDEDEAKTTVETKNFKKDKFWNMPPLLNTPRVDSNSKKGTRYGTYGLLRLHDTFDSKEEIKIILGTKAIEEGFQIRYPRSDPQRLEAKCIDKTCGWIFRAYIPKGYKKFFVTAFIDIHTCTRSQIHPHHRNASPKVLGHILKEVMSESSRIYRGKEIMSDMKARFKIDISYSQAWRAKCYALQLLRGTPEESFAELPLYFHNLKLKNPGTITHIETDDEDRFELFFVAVGAVIRTFVAHMRPLIIIDGAHLKGDFLGTMYLAVAMDGNNQILPLAYGVGKSETFQSWNWFLEKLKECIVGKQDHLTIISDGAVAIASAIVNVFPNAYHGRCCRHVLMNLREKCPRFISKEKMFWKACKAYRISCFEERFSELRDSLPSIADKLERIGFEKWARFHFPGMRYNYMTSNSAESVNALSRHARKLPVCMLIDWFIKSLQQWYFEHRQSADEHKHELTPWAEAKLAQRIAKSTSWSVKPAANYLYNVVDYYKNATVDLNTRTCTCGQWQLSGLPCGHLIAVMRHLRQSSANVFAYSCFNTDVWRDSYKEVIYDVGHPSEWEQPDDLIIVHPPIMKARPPGRPRNRDRVRSKGEQMTQKSCTRCFKGGHSRRDCPSVVPSQIFYPSSSSMKSCSSWSEEI